MKEKSLSAGNTGKTNKITNWQCFCPRMGY